MKKITYTVFALMMLFAACSNPMDGNRIEDGNTQENNDTSAMNNSGEGVSSMSDSVNKKSNPTPGGVNTVTGQMMPAEQPQNQTGSELTTETGTKGTPATGASGATGTTGAGKEESGHKGKHK
jgi:hypothetical protein